MDLIVLAVRWKYERRKRQSPIQSFLSAHRINQFFPFFLLVYIYLHESVLKSKNRLTQLIDIFGLEENIFIFTYLFIYLFIFQNKVAMSSAFVFQTSHISISKIETNSNYENFSFNSFLFLQDLENVPFSSSMLEF